jgi:hypothetical protein
VTRFVNGYTLAYKGKQLSALRMYLFHIFTLYFRGLLSSVFGRIDVASVTVAQDPFATQQCQLHALTRALRERIDAVDLMGSLQYATNGTAILKIVDTYSKTVDCLDSNVGLRLSEYFVTLRGAAEQRDKVGAGNDVRQKISTRSAAGCSLNWVKDLCIEQSNKSIVDNVESLIKRLKFVCGGSLEVTSGITGSLEGAVKRNVGKPQVSSRLCRRSMLELLLEVRSDSNYKLPYWHHKCTNQDFVECLRSFESLPRFQAWHRNDRAEAKCLRDQFVLELVDQCPGNTAKKMKLDIGLPFENS